MVPVFFVKKRPSTHCFLFEIQIHCTHFLAVANKPPLGFATRATWAIIRNWYEVLLQSCYGSLERNKKQFLGLCCEVSREIKVVLVAGVGTEIRTEDGEGGGALSRLFQLPTYTKVLLC